MRKKRQPESLPTLRSWRRSRASRGLAATHVYREGTRARRRPHVSPLRHAVGGRATPPRPPESEIGEVGGGTKASGISAEQRHSDRPGGHTRGGPSRAGPEARGRAGEGAFAQLLTAWKTDLEALKAKLATVDGLTGLKDRLTAGWLAVPKALPKSLRILTEKVEAKPDQTAALDAQTFLTTAQLRLSDYREAVRKKRRRRSPGFRPRRPTTPTAAYSRKS